MSYYQKKYKQLQIIGVSFMKHLYYCFNHYFSQLYYNPNCNYNPSIKSCDDLEVFKV